MRSGLWRSTLSVEETAAGIIGIANEHMAKAIREISVNGVMIRRILCWPVLVARVGFTFVLWQRRCACIRLTVPPGRCALRPWRVAHWANANMGISMDGIEISALGGNGNLESRATEVSVGRLSGRIGLQARR